MSESSINEWDAADASDDDDGLQTPKTPGSPVSSPEAQTPKYSNVSPSYNPTSPTAYYPTSPTAYMSSEAPAVGGAESPRYSNVSPSFRPTSPTAYMRSEEERAYEAQREMDEKIEAQKEQDRRKTPAALVKRDAEHAMLLPLFNAAGLKLPKVDDENWKSHNGSLHKQIDEDQKEIYQMEAELRLKKNAHGAAESFYYSHHA